MDGLAFKKRSHETWTNECERCTGQQQKIKTKRRKRFCMKCDRPSGDLSCYEIREGLKFVWQPKLRFHGYAYFDQNLQKINMPGLINHKNELLKLFKSCRTLCAEHGKVTMLRTAKKNLAFTMQVKYGMLTVTLHSDVVVDGMRAVITINHDDQQSVQLTEDELCTLLTKIDLDYPNIVKKQQYQAAEEDGH